MISWEEFIALPVGTVLVLPKGTRFRKLTSNSWGYDRAETERVLFHDGEFKGWIVSSDIERMRVISELEQLAEVAEK